MPVDEELAAAAARARAPCEPAGSRSWTRGVPGLEAHRLVLVERAGRSTPASARSRRAPSAPVVSAFPSVPPIPLRYAPPVRVAVLSDIHANVAALEAVLAAIPLGRRGLAAGRRRGLRAGARRGRRPPARRSARVGVRGNHDAAALGRLDIDAFNVDARRAMEWTQRRSPPDTREWLDGPARAPRARGLPARPRQPARPDLGVHDHDAGRPGRDRRHADDRRPPRPHARPDRLRRGRRAASRR